ncbi:hypothetical protein TWF730_008661 [Orbilia blumenaviensis]|uniref:Uncharacterized protein n=1 Tax=Orbilia blumenaviensis TaxID=1796055 RepID=A0AAV9V640_9PEZI
MSSQSADDSSSHAAAPSYPQRRGSITEYFRPPQPSTYPGPITTAAAQANHRRRMSYSETSTTGTSPPAPWFGGYASSNGGAGGRRASISSISSRASSMIDVDSDEKRDFDLTSSPPNSSSGSFARRLSFGARALMDVKRSMSFGTVGEGEPENEHRATQESMGPPPRVPAQNAAPKHDEVQERMLKGDFYF